jgi:tripartite-type tricarboxylate transporter receptor subunit TctC
MHAISARRKSMRFDMRFFISLVVMACSTIAFAQNWPTKPIRIVVQFPPGDTTDSVARKLAQALTPSLGQQVLVENRPGADGAIAGELVARSEPDGHTFFLASVTSIIQVPLLKKNAPYDPVRDFAPVSLVGRYVFALVTNPTVPAKDVGELLAYARANPGKLNYGSSSATALLMYHHIRNSAKVEIGLVPYKGPGPTVTDLLGGHIQFAFVSLGTSIAHIKEGRLRALAIMPERNAMLSGIPTVTESGLPPVKAEVFAALFAPARVPEPVVSRMSKELNAVVARPDLREHADMIGFPLAGSTPGEMGTFLQDQLQVWGRVFREAGLKPE